MNADVSPSDRRRRRAVRPHRRRLRASDSQFDYNVVGQRIVAALIDLLPLVLLFLAMAAYFGDLGSTDGGFSVNLTGWPAALYFFLSWGYFVIFEGLTATTPGKSFMGLKVVKLDGERCDWRAVLLRNILRFVDGAPLFYLVGLISIGMTRKGQRLGDLAAGTVVVRPLQYNAASP